MEKELLKFKNLDREYKLLLGRKSTLTRMIEKRYKKLKPLLKEVKKLRNEVEPLEDELIILKSKTNSSFIHYSGLNYHYRIGMNNGNFGIWNTQDIDIINASCLDNTYTNFNNVISFNYTANNIYPTINLNGSIISSSNLRINNITTYVDNNQDYQMRVFGNIKIDGIVMSASDIRLKTNINKIENALDKISKLNGVTYCKKEGKAKETGLIAQEVEEIIPEGVSKYYNNDIEYKSIQYERIIPYLTGSIQYLENLLQIQNKRIEDLEFKLNNMNK